MTTLVRPLRLEDEPAWRRLWAGYLAFYRTTLPDEATDALFRRLIRGEPHFGLIAERDGESIGIVHCLPHASTWSLEGYCYLEDLFVDPEARGTGAGRALIEAVYAEADKRGLSRVYWHTQENNARARRLYDTVARLSDFVQYRR